MQLNCLVSLYWFYTMKISLFHSYVLAFLAKQLHFNVDHPELRWAINEMTPCLSIRVNGFEYPIWHGSLQSFRIGFKQQTPVSLTLLQQNVDYITLNLTKSNQTMMDLKGHLRVNVPLIKCYNITSFQVMGMSINRRSFITLFSIFVRILKINFAKTLHTIFKNINK